MDWVFEPIHSVRLSFRRGEDPPRPACPDDGGFPKARVAAVGRSCSTAVKARAADLLFVGDPDLLRSRLACHAMAACVRAS